MQWFFTKKRRITVAIFVVFSIISYSEAGFACLSNPCINGICVDDVNSTYTCYCIDGYTGSQCQTNWDECWSSPCLNGGSCIDGIASYNCSCSEGYTGSNCEQDINECASNPCQNNGTCVDIRNGFTCQCISGYIGLYCEVDLAVCNSSNEIRCFNGGLCVDGPGLSYTCQCQKGWSGNLCEEDVNECLSPPCQNGGACVNLQAGYACACLYGYTGHNCETELELCEMNLCKNGALCLIENDMRVCYCVPDFHGDRCQFQYDECQLRGRCLNGGTCIDGIDNYTCSCPPRITGSHCECFTNNSGEYECEKTYTITAPTDQTLLYLNESDVTENIEYTTSEKITDIVSIPFSVLTKIITTDIVTIPTTEPPESTRTVTAYHKTLRPVKNAETETTFTSEYAENTVINTEEINLTEEFDTTPGTTINTTIEEQRTPKYIELKNQTEFTKYYDGYTTNLDYVTGTKIQRTKLPIHSIETLQPRTDSYFTTLSEYYYSTKLSDTFSKSFEPENGTEAKLSTFDTTIKYFTKSVDTFDNFTSSQSTIQKTQLMPETTESLEKTIETELTTFLEEWTITKYFADTTIVPFNQCANDTCFNGGTCHGTIEESKCVCRFGWDGSQCESMLNIMIVAFTGKSYLIHYLNNSTTAIISLKLRTLSSTGILFYAQITSNMYMYLYVQNGFLKFQFSCGIQAMLFSETKYRINTGFQTSILATITFRGNIQNSEEGECYAALRINETVAMSGEQTTTILQTLLNLPLLYIGGLPKYLIQQLDLAVADGIIGCIHSLQIDGEDRNIYTDAFDGYDITECSSLACISNPCYRGATCIEHGHSWNCLCPSGYVGKTCSISICNNNPCQFGATCILYPTNGFLCLCPLGKHGLFCEQDLEISQPAFSSTIRGYSSFIAYRLPTSSIQHSFELRLKFIPETMEQISLMAFIGQHDQHDHHSDYLSLSFIKGYIALTWNLGAGPRRIFTPRPIAKKSKKVHAIKIGRTGSKAWLFVDGFKNITGRSSGRHTQLNVTPIIYFGGHESFNFMKLPHDLPLHTGFAGCIYDIEIQTYHIILGLQKTPPVIGRFVAQCGTSECSNYTCQHGGACLQYGSTFSCLCQDGWFGPVCAYRHNLCDPNYHKCAFGSTCVPLELSYECDCPIGQTGKYCEKSESQLSDVSFSGRRSFLFFVFRNTFHTKQFLFEFEIKPFNDYALILYVFENESTMFLSLVLKGGILEFRILTFGNNKKLESENHILTVRSGTVISIHEWTKIRAGRFGQKLYLSVNGVTNSKIIPADDHLKLANVSVYFGGANNLTDIPNKAISGLPVPYSGCVRKFSINYEQIILNEDSILSARNIADCDGTSCGADVCNNGGTCWLNTTLEPHCVCPEEYSGERCENQLSCDMAPCKNKGRCVANSNGPACHCPLGWVGAFCEKEMPSITPFLRDNSYIIIDKRPLSIKKRQSTNNNLSNDLIHIKFFTTKENGLLLWNVKDEQFFGVGIQDGIVKVVWSIEESVNQFYIDSNITVNNGMWHTVIFKFNDFQIMSSIDDTEISSKNYSIKYFLNTDGLFYLGGFPDNRVFNETKGIFSSNFNGCIEEFAWNKQMMITNFKKYKGENVGSCFEHGE